MIPASGYGKDSGDSDVKIELEGDEIQVAEKIKVKETIWIELRTFWYKLRFISVTNLKIWMSQFCLLNSFRNLCVSN